MSSSRLFSWVDPRDCRKGSEKFSLSTLMKFKIFIWWNFWRSFCNLMEKDFALSKFHSAFSFEIHSKWLHNKKLRFKLKFIHNSWNSNLIFGDFFRSLSSWCFIIFLIFQVVSHQQPKKLLPTFFQFSVPDQRAKVCKFKFQFLCHKNFLCNVSMMQTRKVESLKKLHYDSAVRDGNLWREKLSGKLFQPQKMKQKKKLCNVSS